MHVDITEEESGNSTGVYTAIRSWKRPSIDDILGVNQGGVSPAGTGKRGGRCRGCDDVENKQDELKEILSYTLANV